MTRAAFVKTMAPKYDQLRQQRESAYAKATADKEPIYDELPTIAAIQQRLSKLELTVNTLVNTVNSLQAAVSKLTFNSPDQGRAVAETPRKPTATARKSYMRAYMAKRRARKHEKTP